MPSSVNDRLLRRLINTVAICVQSSNLAPLRYALSSMLAEASPSQVHICLRPSDGSSFQITPRALIKTGLPPGIVAQDLDAVVNCICEFATIVS